MFLKLLLTALVIVGALTFVRMRKQKEQLSTPSTPSRSQQSDTSLSSMVRVAAVVSVVLMLLGAGAYLYFQWQDNYQVVVVRVVDTRSGNENLYHAYKGEIEARGFITTEGRQISLAEVERMEIGGAE